MHLVVLLSHSLPTTHLSERPRLVVASLATSLSTTRAVPEFTRGADIKLNARVSLRRQRDILSWWAVVRLGLTSDASATIGHVMSTDLGAR